VSVNSDFITQKISPKIICTKDTGAQNIRHPCPKPKKFK